MRKAVKQVLLLGMALAVLIQTPLQVFAMDLSKSEAFPPDGTMPETSAAAVLEPSAETIPEESPEPTASPIPTAEPAATPVPTAEPTAIPTPTAQPTAEPTPEPYPVAELAAEPMATPAIAVESTEGLKTTEDSELQAQDFSCYTYDAMGHKLDAYWSEEDGVWYLFETSTQQVADTRLYYTGDVDAVSIGELDEGSSSVTDAFEESGDTVVLTEADGTVQTVVVLQSDLPGVYITLNGTTLDEIHADKDKKYKGNSFSLMDPASKYDLEVEDSVEMKGRGNSTWTCYDKKGYQIKFDDKTDVMGMGKAKKWVLLANAGDDSMMRTQLVYHMADNLGMTYVPSFRYVDLWIDGEYRGTYMLGEKVEIGSSRLDLQEDTGALFEHDEAFYQEEDYWLYSTMLERHFVMKEINEEEDEYIQAAMDDFGVAVDNFVSYLYSTPTWQITLDDLSAMIDVDSFAKYYLVNEYTLNRESFATSFYWYKDGPEDVIHLGPIWDFDTCMGNDGVVNTESYGENHILFEYLLAIPSFQERTQELYEQYRDEFIGMTNDVDAVAAELENAANLNYTRWDSLGKPNPKGGADFHDTYAEATAALKQWLSGRETAFHIAESSTVASKISDDCTTMDIYFKDDQSYQQVRFAVWSADGGQNDLFWHFADKQADGAWHCQVDLSQHNSAGMYNIVAYSETSNSEIASGRNYVAKAVEPRYHTSAVVSDGCETMRLTMEDTTGKASSVTFAVWSEEGGQDDLAWYNAAKDANGSWNYTVDMYKHHSAGNYNVHVYVGSGAEREMADAITVNVPTAVDGPVLTAVVSDDDTTIQLALSNVEGYQNIWAPTWSAVNGQDDIQWYELRQTAEGTWTGEVELDEHGDLGTYRIHIYGGDETPVDLIRYTDIRVDRVVERHIKAAVSDDNAYMTVTIEDIGDWDQVWVPVWSVENGQDDIQWYQPQRNADDTYTYTVNLRDHMSAGEYNVHVYGGNRSPDELVAYTTVEVPALPDLSSYMSASLQGSVLTVVLQDDGGFDEVWIPVWSEENGQDDIRWYRPTRQGDGTLTLIANLNAHDSLGPYHVHVYGGSESPQNLLAYENVNVLSMTNAPVLSTVLTGNTLTVELLNADDLAQVWIPVWSEAGGQDDIAWYEAVLEADGNWVCQVELDNHGAAPYHVHAYTGDGTPGKLVTYTDVRAA